MIYSENSIFYQHTHTHTHLLILNIPNEMKMRIENLKKIRRKGRSAFENYHCQSSLWFSSNKFLSFWYFFRLFNDTAYLVETSHKLTFFLFLPSLKISFYGTRRISSRTQFFNSSFHVSLLSKPQLCLRSFCLRMELDCCCSLYFFIVSVFYFGDYKKNGLNNDVFLFALY